MAGAEKTGLQFLALRAMDGLQDSFARFGCSASSGPLPSLASWLPIVAQRRGGFLQIDLLHTANVTSPSHHSTQYTTVSFRPESNAFGLSPAPLPTRKKN